MPLRSAGQLALKVRGKQPSELQVSCNGTFNRSKKQASRLCQLFSWLLLDMAPQWLGLLSLARAWFLLPLLSAAATSEVFD